MISHRDREIIKDEAKKFLDGLCEAPGCHEKATKWAKEDPSESFHFCELHYAQNAAFYRGR